jgi:hypothetical protein
VLGPRSCCGTFDLKVSTFLDGQRKLTTLDGSCTGTAPSASRAHFHTFTRCRRTAVVVPSLLAQPRPGSLR